MPQALYKRRNVSLDRTDQRDRPAIEPFTVVCLVRYDISQGHSEVIGRSPIEVF